MIRFASLALVAVFLASATSAQQSSQRGPLRASDLVEWSARVVPGDDAGEAQYEISATVSDGWRVYAVGSEGGIPLTLTLGRLPDGVDARGPMRQTRPSRATDVALGFEYTYHTGRFKVAQPLQITRRAAGRHRISSTLRFAVCNDSVCLPPATVDLRATLAVRG